MSTDAALFELEPAELLEGVRDVGVGAPVGASVGYVLGRSGLVADGRLTEAGTALFKMAVVAKQQDAALTLLGLALRNLTPVQVLEQELHHFGAVPEEGALDLLKLHRAVPLGLALPTARATFRSLAKVGLVAYSSKFKTVRVLAPPPEELRAGELGRLAAMVSPKTPWMNVVRLRRIIRGLSGTVWWADRHFGARALEELAEELDPERVSAVRIISGSAENVVTSRSLRDFHRFRDEMAQRGVTASWRVDGRAGDWHDRWLVASEGAWNMPPVNTLFKNDHSEILPTDARPPLEDWWHRAVDRDA
jgi:hypothetical protein